MSSPPKVSIITRTKNRKWLLKRSIQSVMLQTLEDWEHIIINDGGEAEELMEILDSFQSDYQDRLKVHHIEKCSGMVNALNQGIFLAEGTYIAVHDDDDSWSPHFLKKTTDFLDGKGEDSTYQGVISMALKVTEKIHENGDIQEMSKEPYIPLTSISLFRLGYENPFPPIAFLYRKRVHEVIGYHNEKYSFASDYDFNIRFIQHHEIAVIKEPLAFYHWRENPENQNDENTVTTQKEIHERLFTELHNDYLRNALKPGGDLTGIALNLSQFLVEDQWRVSESLDILREFRHMFQTLQQEKAELETTVDALKCALNNISKSESTVQMEAMHARLTQLEANYSKQAEASQKTSQELEAIKSLLKNQS